MSQGFVLPEGYSPEDVFNYRIGRAIALGRALKRLARKTGGSDDN